MGEPGHGEITELLLAWSGGEASALDKIVPQVYAELHRLAHRYLWHERAGHTLQTSDLIHEAYLRLKYRSARISRFSLASPLP